MAAQPEQPRSGRARAAAGDSADRLGLLDLRLSPALDNGIAQTEASSSGVRGKNLTSSAQGAIRGRNGAVAKREPWLVPTEARPHTPSSTEPETETMRTESKESDAGHLLARPEPRAEQAAARFPQAIASHTITDPHQASSSTKSSEEAPTEASSAKDSGSEAKQEREWPWARVAASITAASRGAHAQASRALDLRGLRLADPQAMRLPDLPHLMALDLSKSPLPRMPLTGWLVGVSELQELRLDACGLSSLPPLEDVAASLRVLSVRRNRLRSLALPAMPALAVVHASANCLPMPLRSHSTAGASRDSVVATTTATTSAPTSRIEQDARCRAALRPLGLCPALQVLDLRKQLTTRDHPCDHRRLGAIISALVPGIQLLNGMRRAGAGAKRTTGRRMQETLQATTAHQANTLSRSRGVVSGKSTVGLLTAVTSSAHQRSKQVAKHAHQKSHHSEMSQTTPYAKREASSPSSAAGRTTGDMIADALVDDVSKYELREARVQAASSQRTSSQRLSQPRWRTAKARRTQLEPDNAPAMYSDPDALSVSGSAATTMRPEHSSQRPQSTKSSQDGTHTNSATGVAFGASAKTPAHLWLSGGFTAMPWAGESAMIRHNDADSQALPLSPALVVGLAKTDLTSGTMSYTDEQGHTNSKGDAARPVPTGPGGTAQQHRLSPKEAESGPSTQTWSPRYSVSNPHLQRPAPVLKWPPPTSAPSDSRSALQAANATPTQTPPGPAIRPSSVQPSSSAIQPVQISPPALPKSLAHGSHIPKWDLPLTHQTSSKHQSGPFPLTCEEDDESYPSANSAPGAGISDKLLVEFRQNSPTDNHVVFSKPGQSSQAVFSKPGQSSQAVFSKPGQSSQAVFSKPGQSSQAVFSKPGQSSQVEANESHSSAPPAVDHSSKFHRPSHQITVVDDHPSHSTHQLALDSSLSSVQTPVLSHSEQIEAKQACITLSAALLAMKAKIDVAQSAEPGSEEQARAVGQVSIIVQRLTKLNLLPQESTTGSGSTPTGGPAWLRPLQHLAGTDKDAHASPHGLDGDDSTDLIQASLSPTQQAQSLVVTVLALAASLLNLPRPASEPEVIHDQTRHKASRHKPNPDASLDDRFKGGGFGSPGTSARKRIAAEATDAILHGSSAELATLVEEATGMNDDHYQSEHQQNSQGYSQIVQAEPSAPSSVSPAQQPKAESFGVATGEMAGDWEVCVDPHSGTPYYYNSVLNTSSWVLPLTEEGFEDE